MRGRHLRLHQCRTVVVGTRPERAVNRLIKAGVAMEAVSFDDELTVSFDCSYGDYIRTGKVLGRQYDVSMDGSYGLVPLLGRVAGRAGLAAGVVCICVILVLQQNIVSEIEIEGNYKNDETELRQSLAAAGLREGARSDPDDFENIKNTILAEYGEIRWINIKKQGGYVLVEIVEGDLNDAGESESIHDVVAAKSGYIERILAKEGYPLVEKGDYAEKGQTLISSLVPLENSTYDASRDNAARVADAEGIVEAAVIYRLQTEFEKGKYSEDEMKALADDGIRNFLRENVPEYIKILNKDLKFEQEENIIVCNVTLSVLEDIAEQKESELSEDGSREQNGKETDKDNNR